MDFQNNRSVYLITVLTAVTFFLLPHAEEILQNSFHLFSVVMPFVIGFAATYFLAFKNTVTKQDCFWTSLVALCVIYIVSILKSGFGGFIFLVTLPGLNFIFSLLGVFALMFGGHWLGFQSVKSKIIASKIDDEITLDRYLK